jgi:predicted DNA-binding protein (MmcQ/YjbR family)
MISQDTVKELALSFPETDEHPHFHLIAFRVRKKIFCTLHAKDNRVMVKLSLTDQSVFCAADPKNIYPVPGGWGRKGATFVELGKVKKSLFKDALTVAYCTVAPAKLGAGLIRK